MRALSKISSASAKARSRCLEVTGFRPARNEGRPGGGTRASSSARFVKNRMRASRVVQTRRPTRTYSNRVPLKPRRHQRQMVGMAIFRPSTFGNRRAASANESSSSSGPIRRVASAADTSNGAGAVGASSTGAPPKSGCHVGGPRRLHGGKTA